MNDVTLRQMGAVLAVIAPASLHIKNPAPCRWIVVVSLTDDLRTFSAGERTTLRGAYDATIAIVREAKEKGWIA